MYSEIIICNFQTKTNGCQFLLINIRYSDIVTNTTSQAYIHIRYTTVECITLYCSVVILLRGWQGWIVE